MINAAIAIPREKIASLCGRHHIRWLALFGSALTDEFGADSDLDVLVQFEAGRTPGFGFITVQDELTELFGRKVDLHTPASLSRYFRDEVMASAETLYGHP